MIKAETIIHEGNPGPNWLEHCRAVVSTKVGGFMLVVIIGLVIIGLFVLHHDKGTPVVTNSQKTTTSGSAAPLTVNTAPGIVGSSSETSGSLQPANNAGDAALPGTTSTTATPGTTATTAVGPAPVTSGTALQQVGGGLQQASQTLQTVINTTSPDGGLVSP